jgi:hypothetical protein
VDNKHKGNTVADKVMVVCKMKKDKVKKQKAFAFI